MKKFLFILLFPFILKSQTLQVQSPVRFLALGDSYTIGQSVTVNQRWPVQLRDSLAIRGIMTDTMLIIATTGWRTDNLISAITNQNLGQQNYNLVSLLIGVNNQYQGSPFSQYVNEFPQLLDSAIRYAGGDTSHVFVVSIPDYAYTPFGQSTGNQTQISQQIDQYNAANKHVADSLHIQYFDITPISRMGLAQPAYVASDGLHPSGIQYTEWVKLMLNFIDPSLATAIKDLKNDISFSIEPNPASDLLTIKSRQALQSIVITDASGSTVLIQNCSSKSQIVHTENFSDGIYFVKVAYNNGLSFTKKVIIAH